MGDGAWHGHIQSGCACCMVYLLSLSVEGKLLTVQNGLPVTANAVNHWQRVLACISSFMAACAAELLAHSPLIQLSDCPWHLLSLPLDMVSLFCVCGQLKMPCEDHGCYTGDVALVICTNIKRVCLHMGRVCCLCVFRAFLQVHLTQAVHACGRVFAAKT